MKRKTRLQKDEEDVKEKSSKAKKKTYAVT